MNPYKRLAELRVQISALQLEEKELREIILQGMLDTGETDVEEQGLMFSLRRKPAKVQFIDGHEIPAEYWAPSDSLIRKDLAKGRHLDFALLEEQGYSLTIKQGNDSE